MKKIQVSTVKMESNVEVIFINSAIISKSLRAQMAANRILEEMRRRSAVKELEQPKYVDEEGNPMPDENGRIEYIPVLDDDGKQRVEFDSYHRMDAENIAAFYYDIVPMLNELVKAFEE